MICGLTTLRMSAGGLLIVAWALAQRLQEGSAVEAEAPSGPLVVELDAGLPPLVIPRDERLSFQVRVGPLPVGKVHMEAEVVDAPQGGVVLTKDRESRAATGHGAVAHMVTRAQGDYKLYNLDAEIETRIHPQRWPWIVYRFEQRGTKKYKRILNIGYQDEKPRVSYARDTEDGAPKGSRIMKEPKTRDLPVPALDMLSAVYYARAMTREERLYLSFPVADKLDVWEIRLSRRKTGVIETDAGSFEGVQILLDPKPWKDEVLGEKAAAKTKRFEGLFGLQGSIELWVERETGIPLRISGDIPVGPLELTIDVSLQSYSGTVLPLARRRRDDGGRGAGVAQPEGGPGLLVAALDVPEHEPGVEREGVAPGGHHAEVALLAVLGEQEPRAGCHGVVVAYAQDEQALVEPAVGVDLGHDLLADVAALLEREGVGEARLLGIHVLADVDAGERRAALDAREVARDDPGRHGPGLAQRAPQRGRERGAAVEP